MKMAQTSVKPKLVLMIMQLLMYAETGTSKNVFHLKAPLLAMEKTHKIGEAIQQRTVVDCKN